MMAEEQRTIFNISDPRKHTLEKLRTELRASSITSSMTLIEQRSLLYMLQRFAWETQEPVEAWVREEGVKTISEHELYFRTNKEWGIPESTNFPHSAPPQPALSAQPVQPAQMSPAVITSSPTA
jgi:hypothetical protein